MREGRWSKKVGGHRGEEPLCWHGRRYELEGVWVFVSVCASTESQVQTQIKQIKTILVNFHNSCKRKHTLGERNDWMHSSMNFVTLIQLMSTWQSWQPLNSVKLIPLLHLWSGSLCSAPLSNPRECERDLITKVFVWLRSRHYIYPLSCYDTTALPHQSWFIVPMIPHTQHEGWWFLEMSNFVSASVIYAAKPAHSLQMEFVLQRNVCWVDKWRLNGEVNQRSMEVGDLQHD